MHHLGKRWHMQTAIRETQGNRQTTEEGHLGTFCEQLLRARAVAHVALAEASIQDYQWLYCQQIPQIVLPLYNKDSKLFFLMMSHICCTKIDPCQHDSGVHPSFKSSKCRNVSTADCLGTDTLVHKQQGSMTLPWRVFLRGVGDRETGRQRAALFSGPRADIVSHQSCCGTRPCARPMLCWAGPTSRHSAAPLEALDNTPSLSDPSKARYLLSRLSNVGRQWAHRWLHSPAAGSLCSPSCDATHLPLPLHMNIHTCNKHIHISRLWRITSGWRMNPDSSSLWPLHSHTNLDATCMCHP